MPVITTDTANTQLLERSNKPDLAYEKVEGNGEVTVIFLGGFRSDMMGTKAEFLKEKCSEIEVSYIRFDYRGHGQSEGKFEDACISEWVEDASDILNSLVSGKALLVGSSMGGWVSLLLALQYPKQIYGLIGLAAAPDFTQWMEAEMSDQQYQELQSKGCFLLSNDYDDPYIITQKLLDDGRKHSLLDSPIQIQCPVHLIQGKRDTAVDWRVANQIKNSIAYEDVNITLLEDADHRLSNEAELLVLHNALQQMLSKTISD